MLEVVALGDDLRMVPLAGRLHDLLGRRIDGIDRAGRGERVLAVAVLVVVEDLVLGAGLVGGAPRLGDAVHDAAVAARGDLPVDLELEVAELLDRADVAALAVEHQDAVGHLPGVGGLVLLVPLPAVQGLAVEERIKAVLVRLRFVIVGSQQGGEGQGAKAQHRHRRNHSSHGFFSSLK